MKVRINIKKATDQPTNQPTMPKNHETPQPPSQKGLEKKQTKQNKTQQKIKKQI